MRKESPRAPARERADAALHLEWRFIPVEGADKYNSGIFLRTATDLSAWHQAQVGLEGGFGLEAEGWRIAFRNLKIKFLD
jgi:hypothetical protein